MIYDVYDNDLAPWQGTSHVSFMQPVKFARYFVPFRLC